MKLKQLIPMLNVHNITASLDFYEQAFGFRIVSDPGTIEEWKWATIQSGDTSLMLTETSSAPHFKQEEVRPESKDWPCIYYFYPDDVKALYQHLLDKGYTPTDLHETFYGMNEFSIRDLDGHLLSFGQETH
jgi:uncharacterized glyoxalase superfamily protein PhnB